MMDKGIVIIGAGHAGVQAAASLREAGFSGPLRLVGDESGTPYHRPPLSKAYITGKAADAQPLRADAFFDQHGIKRVAGIAAVAVDAKARTVSLENGETLDFDHLVLATGSRARKLDVPGANLSGIFQLRRREDAAAIRDALGQARRAVIVGAGFIGLEFAAVAAARGIDCTVIEAADAALCRALSKPMAEYLVGWHRENGVDFRFNQCVAAFEAGDNGRVTAVHTVAGDVIPADIVLVGIGADAETALAEKAGLKTGGGIIVDAYLRTSSPFVSAIGDCARFSHPRTGEPIRLESVQNATDQARNLALTLTGQPVPYAAIPWFWSDQGPLKLQMAGLSSGCDDAVVGGDPATGRFSVYCFRDGVLASVESINRPADHMAARNVLKACRPGAGPDVHQVKDPGFSLKNFVMKADEAVRA